MIRLEVSKSKLPGGALVLLCVGRPNVVDRVTLLFEGVSVKGQGEPPQR